MMTRDAIFKVLQEIQASVPKGLRNSVVRKQDTAPTVSMVIQKALEDPDFPEEKKENLRNMIDAGIINLQKPMEDPVIAKKIDNYVNRKINQAVKEGRLPNKKQLAEILSNEKGLH